MRISVFALAVGALALSACGGGLDPEKFQQHLATYSTLETNKAMVMNSQNYRLFWVWDRASPERALGDAKASCEGEGGISSCVPIAVNDTQLYNPVPGAIAAQQRQNEMNQQTQRLLIQTIPYLRR